MLPARAIRASQLRSSLTANGERHGHQAAVMTPSASKDAEVIPDNQDNNGLMSFGMSRCYRVCLWFRTSVRVER